MKQPRASSEQRRASYEQRRASNEQRGMPNPASFKHGVASSSRINPEHEVSRPTWEFYFSVIFAACSVLGNGFDIGAFGFAITEFEDRPELGLEPWQIATLAGMYNIVTAFASFAVGPLYDAYGRKLPMIIGGVIQACGILIVASGSNFTVMFTGRFIMGCGAGMAFAGPEMYASELAPSHIRGVAVTLGELFINVGALLGYIIGSALFGQWRLYIGVGAIIPLATAFMQMFILESPRWLFEQGKEGAALAVLNRAATYPEGAQEIEISEIKEEIAAEKAGSGSTLQTILSPNVPLQKAMIAGWGLAFFQQAIGSEAILLFGPTILAAAFNQVAPDSTTPGAAVQWDVLYAVIFKILFILLSMSLMDVVGRRPLILLSSVGCAVSLLALSILFQDAEPPINFAAALFIVFMALYSIGFGPITGVIISEVFPLHIRGTANGIAWGINRLTGGILGIAFLPLYNLVGFDAMFIGFSFVAVAAMIHSAYFVPETRGLAMEDIQHLLGAPFAENNETTGSEAAGREEQGSKTSV